MRQSFALIYVMLFSALIGITIFATWAAGMSDMRQARTNESSTEAYQLAKSAIDTGWVQYKSAPGADFPDDACGTPTRVQRINPDADLIGRSTTLQDPILSSESQAGIYDVRVCIGPPKFIEGIGYYKGNKITLRGDISADDELLIYQKGPSQ